jgi:TolB protein
MPLRICRNFSLPPGRATSCAVPTTLRRAPSAAAAALLCLLCASAARADRPVITVEGARIQAFPLAVAPALGDPTAGKAVMAVLSGDLERSGLFKLLDPASFLEDPARVGLDASKIDFSKWTTVGAAGLVKASVQLQGGDVQADFRLYDVGKGAEVLHGTYSAKSAGLRQVAHRFADDVFRFFTQEAGVFQTRLAWVRESEAGKQIVVSDADGHEVQALTGSSINLLPAWAPDGRTIAFTTFRDGAAHIYTVDALSRAVKPLVLMGDFAAGAAYARDGLRFTFSASLEDNTDVYLSQADGSVGKRLTKERGIDTSATWSPDGKQICFVSDRVGAPHLYLMNADGSGQKRLTFKGNYNQEPAWSPRGDLIAFSGRDERRVFDIYTINVNTGEMKRLTSDAGTNEKPSWAPNGRLIIFSSTRTGKRQLWTMSPDGSNARQLTDEPRGASDPAWGPLPQ